MKKYRVTVNGTVYEIELEELTGATPASASASTPTANTSGGERVTSPMPGTILSVNIAPNDIVRRGQVLMILEAMKMENEIICPHDGKIISVNTAKGATVESGTLLCVIQ